ncbi:MAG: oligosaccharide flippase family protein [Candidatus Riflebacteria bacterium]|nr:oligosaccharide flippase family protein [Candidatus Riflebacteria bacterium]
MEEPVTPRGDAMTAPCPGSGLPGYWARLRELGIVRDVGSLGAGGIFAVLINVAAGLLIARWLGPEHYGIAALVASFPDAVFCVLDARSNAATVRYLTQFQTSGEPARARAMCKLGYCLDVSIALCSVGVVALASGWAETHLVHSGGAASLMLVYAAGFVPRALVGTSGAVLVARGKFQLSAGLEVVSSVLRSLLVLAFVFAGWGISGVIYGGALGNLVSGAIFAVVAARQIQAAWGGSWFTASLSALRGKLGEILKFLCYTDLTELLGIPLKQLDLLFLGYFRGPSDAGYYRLAKTLSGLVAYGVGPLQAVAYPRLTRLVEPGRADELKRLVRSFGWVVGLPGAGAIVLCSGAAGWLLPAIAGTAYTPAVTPTQVLLLSSAVWTSCFWMRPLFWAQGRASVWAATALVHCILALALFPTMASAFGATGIALAVAGLVTLTHALGGLYLAVRGLAPVK